MRLNTYTVALVAFPVSMASQAAYDFGYWDVTAHRAWPASGYRSWGLEANYSATPGVMKRTSYLFSPVNGSEETTHNDINFQSTFNSDGKVAISQSVILSGQAVDVTGEGKIDCSVMSASGRGCSGSTRINAKCVGERCTLIGA